MRPIRRYSSRNAVRTCAVVCPTARRAPMFFTSRSILLLIVKMIITRHTIMAIRENTVIKAARIFVTPTYPAFASSME